MSASLILDHIGFSGQVHFPGALPARMCHQISDASHFPGEKSSHLAQLLSAHPAPISLELLSHSAPRASLYLAGLLWSEGPLPLLADRIAVAIQQERYIDLPEGEYCGCLFTENDIWFWKTRTSNVNIFYRREGLGLCWSTDPRMLVTEQDLSHDALVQCCLGDDVFVYEGIEYISAGTIVKCSATRTRVTVFDPIPPCSHPPRVTLPDLAAEARAALIEATCPLAHSQHKIGLLLSGGIDSAAVAAALVQHGAAVTAYHLEFDHPAASESAYAQAVCKMLSIPLVVVPATTGNDYLSSDWRFSHPYGHAGLRWMQLIAERACQDGISFLMTGRGGDPTFGPLDSYGLVDICSAPIAASEKLKMLAGAISTDWLLPDILKSLGRSHSLINDRSLSPRSQDHSQAPPFLCHQPLSAHLREPFEQTGFSPHDLVLETAIWQPSGLHMIHPYHHHAVQQVGRHIPAAYRLIPYKGMRVVKPVLRMAFADLLPP